MQKNEKDVANSCHTISLTRRNVSGPESRTVYTRITLHVRTFA